MKCMTEYRETVISVGKKGPKGVTDAYYGCKKVRKTFWFVIYSCFKDSAFTAVERHAKF